MIVAFDSVNRYVCRLELDLAHDKFLAVFFFKLPGILQLPKTLQSASSNKITHTSQDGKAGGRLRFVHVTRITEESVNEKAQTSTYLPVQLRRR